MDGWESRRRRTPATTGASSRSACAGVVRGVNVDTRFFTGNFPSHCSIDALDATRPLRPAVLCRPKARRGRRSCRNRRSRGDGDNFFAIDERRPWTHLRLNIFPDGGVARLRVYGEVDGRLDARSRRAAAPSISRRSGTAAWCSARATCTSARKDNMIMPGRATNMGDGWETRRRRGPGSRLGDRPARRAGHDRDASRSTPTTSRATIPDSASLEGCLAPGAALDALASARGRDPAADQAAAASPALLREGARARRAGLPRAAQHLSRRRRQPAARPWNRWQRLDARRRGRGAARCCDVLRLDALGRPDAGAAAVRQPATRCSRRARDWFALDAGDWREAFSHHPKIGDRDATARAVCRDRTTCPSASRRASTARPKTCSTRSPTAIAAYERTLRLHLHRLRDRARARTRCWRCCGAGSTTIPAPRFGSPRRSRRRSRRSDSWEDELVARRSAEL